MSMIAKGIEKVQSKTFHTIILVGAILTALFVGSCAMADESPPTGPSLPEVADQMINTGGLTDEQLEAQEGIFVMFLNALDQIKEEFGRLMEDKAAEEVSGEDVDPDTSTAAGASAEGDASIL